MTDATSEGNAPTLHPAEHRGYRELYAASRHLLTRWRKLAEATSDTDFAAVLEEAARGVRELLEALEKRTAPYGLHGRPSAQGLGAGLGEVRSAVLDRSIDTGVAVRLAVLDVEHVATLLAQLAKLAAARGDSELEEFCVDWKQRLRPEVKAVRKAAVRLGGDPDRVARPLDSSPIGQAMHRAGWAIGTLGEWVDRRSARAPEIRGAGEPVARADRSNRR